MQRVLRSPTHIDRSVEIAIMNFPSVPSASIGLTVGADTAVAVISKGAGADYGTKTLQKPLMGCVFAGKGLIADLSLERSKINKIDG
jgi:lipid-binding SYLF domain-containing protein